MTTREYLEKLLDKVSPGSMKRIVTFVEGVIADDEVDNAFCMTVVAGCIDFLFRTKTLLNTVLLQLIHELSKLGLLTLCHF